MATATQSIQKQYQPKVDWAEISDEIYALRCQGDRIELRQLDEVMQQADRNSNPQPTGMKAVRSEFNGWFKR